MRSGSADAPALSLLTAAMDATWMAAYILLLGTIWLRPETPLLHPLIVLSLLWGAQTLARRVLAGRTPAAAVLALSGAGAAAAAVAVQYAADPWWRTHGSLWHALDLALLTVRPELPALVVAALIWRRGIIVGRTELEYYDVENVFRLGLGAFVVFAASMAAGRSVGPVAAAGRAAFPYLLAFFAVSLFALPIARLRSVRLRTRAPQHAISASNDWYGMIAAAVAATLAAAVIAGALLRLDVGAAFRALGRLLDPVLWALLYVIAIPLGVVVSGLIWLIRRVLHPAAPQPLHPPGPPGWLDSLAQHQAAGLSPEAATALRWGAVFVLLILGLLWLARAAFRYEHTAEAPPADETRESVWSWDDLLAGWRARFRRRARTSPARRPAFGSGPGAAVRRAYAELLGAAAALGIARTPDQTPDEFTRVLARTAPPARGPAEALTAIYVRVRYGLEAPSEEDVAAALGALAEVGAYADAARGGGRTAGNE